MSTPDTTTDGREIAIGGLPPTLPIVVTEQIGNGAGTAPSAPAAGQAAAVIERQLRDILGWTPKAADTQGLVRALEKSYSPIVENGYTRWVYTPRGTALPVEAAEITGAQGSLYMRTKGAADDMFELLDSLEPMRESADHDATEGIRAIVHSTLSQIVDEIGRDGGPSVPLVDTLFLQLLGDNETETDPANVDGDVGRLRDRFYFDRRFISTLADETNFTKFLTFVDYATSLRASWVAQRTFFDGTSTDPYFGPQLSKLRWILETLGQNVEEVFVALDSVVIDQTERQTLAKGSLFLQPTLEWIQRYVTEDAPRLIDYAGRDGAVALLPNLVAMADAIGQFIPPQPDFPTLYNTPLVFATLQSLQRGLVEAANTVNQIKSGPGADEITLKAEVFSTPGVPDPDKTPAPPVVVTVEGSKEPPVSRYVVDIDHHKEGDEYRLVDPRTGTENPGHELRVEHGRATWFFEIQVEDEPDHYDIVRIRAGKPTKLSETVPTSVQTQV